LKYRKTISRSYVNNNICIIFVLYLLKDKIEENIFCTRNFIVYYVHAIGMWNILDIYKYKL